MKNLSVVTAPSDCKVFTPPLLAQAMAGMLEDRPTFQWLEPCVGRGVFLESLGQVGVDAARITAVELDHHKELDRKCGTYLPGVDFLGWSLRTKKRFDRIIGNPPFHKLYRGHRDVIEAARQISKPGGGTVPLGANCWYAFLCASINLLNPGGSICFILPSGWEYADYALDLRGRIPKLFARFETIRSNKSFFPGTLDGCVVMIADGFGQPNTKIKRYDFPDSTGVIAHLRSPGSPLNSELNVPVKTNDSTPTSYKSLVRFGDVAHVRIGAVTGDASFFLLNESRRVELGISNLDVRRVLTRARHLDRPFVTSANWQTLREREERVWLFWPESRPGPRPKAVDEYLSIGKQQLCHMRQKTRNREPWFRAKINSSADGFMSGMTSVGPWLCLNRAKDLTATNTLYTIHFKNRLALHEKAAWSLSLVCSTTAAQHAEIGRRYSKGLFKFEPRDVISLMIPTPVDLTRRAIEVYACVIDNLLEDRIDRARDLAEAFVISGKCPKIAAKKVISMKS